MSSFHRINLRQEQLKKCPYPTCNMSTAYPGNMLQHFRNNPDHDIYGVRRANESRNIVDEAQESPIPITIIQEHPTDDVDEEM